MSEDKKLDTVEEAAPAVPAERKAASLAEKPAPQVPAEKVPAGLPAETTAPAEKEEAAAPAPAETYSAPEAEVEIAIRDDRDDAADSLIHWAAARAGVIVVAPLLGTIALMANEVYMIAKIGETYNVKLADKTVLSFIGALGGTVTGTLAATLIPLSFMQVPIAVGVTYGIGKAAQRWIKDGMPDDVKPYMAVFEKEKEKGEENVAELKEDPKKDQPLGDETVKFGEEKEERKLYPEEAHAAFGKLTGKVTEAASFASARFLEALKKAGVTDEQIEKAKYTAIGVTEVAKETAQAAAKELSLQAKVKSKELHQQAKEKSKEVSAQAKDKSREFSAQAKEQLDVLKEKGRKLRLEADIRAAEAKVRSEQAKAEARIRMAQARVQAAYMKAHAQEQTEIAKVKAAELSEKAQVQAAAAKVKAAELSEKVQGLAKEYKENALKAAAEAKETFRSAAEDFKAKALERADQRRAEQHAADLEKAAAAGPVQADTAPAEAEKQPVEEKAVDKKE